MKKEWKPEELRATSEEIRGAVMPKTITPEMVGGTLAGLTDALGEVVEVLGEIPREHVKVIVKATDGEQVVSAAGATVWLDIFNTPGFPATTIPRQELTCNDTGEVEFDVPHGFSYALFSQVAGLGASFQFVYHSAVESRVIRLFNLPIGILQCWQVAYANDDAGTYEYRPIPLHTATDDIGADGNPELWLEEGEYTDDILNIAAVFVSTAETSFAIEPENLSPEQMRWSSGAFFGDCVPTLPQYGCSQELQGDAWDEGWQAGYDKAVVDFDGNMNTAKLLAVDNGDNAARWCRSRGTYNSCCFLPSCGQLKIMQENRTAINAMMIAMNDLWDCGFQLLPYTNDKGQWQNPNGHYEYWWSSTAFNEYCTWVVNINGYIYYYYRDYTNDVRAVSAFHFEY